jgi:hypothetical protein
MVPLLFTAISINSLRAQLTTATILGGVRDASGGMIQRANIEAKAVATNLVRSTITDEEGNYILTNLPVGEYELTASATGFKKEIQEGIVLQVAQRARIDIVLQTGRIPLRKILEARIAVELEFLKQRYQTAFR